MLEILADPAVWAAFLTLTVMEIVLGIDNIVFISVLVSRLPREQAEFARKLGIGLALVFRIVLLLLISVIVQLDQPVFTLFGQGFSWKDIILVAGGGSVVISSHVMALVEQICDHVAVVDEGRMLVAGPLDEVRAGASLEERFTSLVGLTTEPVGLSWL